MSIKNIAVIGSGTMGNGIAHVFALHGYKVMLIDIKSELLEKAISTVKGNLERQLKKEAITEEQLKNTLSKTSTRNFETVRCQLINHGDEIDPSGGVIILTD